MTREDAIDRLRKISEKTPIRTNGDDLVAITMAIQALSQEPCIYDLKNRYCPRLNEHGMLKYPLQEQTTPISTFDIAKQFGIKLEPCDAVSREAVLEAVSEGCQEWRGIYGRCEELINELPSVTQKSGKWTLMYEPKNMAVCSECGKCAYMYQDKTSAFCPHCGAYMREEQTDAT